MLVNKVEGKKKNILGKKSLKMQITGVSKQ
jgi:hypothetical protein